MGTNLAVKTVERTTGCISWGSDVSEHIGGDVTLCVAESTHG